MLKEVYEEVEVNEILAEFYTEHGDSDKAFQYARSSWDAGRIKCAYILGSLYLGENSKYRNIQEGMRILKYASQKGDVDAMLLYGIELIKREKYADSLTVLKQAYNNGQEMAKPYIDALEEGFRTNEI